MRDDLNIRCPECNGTQTRYRLKTKDHQCYICGNSWADEVVEDE